MAESDYIVVVDNVSRVFKPGGVDVHALTEVSMNVRRGEICALIGRSGSGKTTLLNLIAGLDNPTSGRIVVDGKDMKTLSDSQKAIHRRKKIGFIFQSFGLLPLLSAQENVELSLRINGVGARERSRRASECLDLVGLGQRRKHRPYELSGGEQQRVAIARAISTRPTLIIADEPTAELDSTTSLQIFSLLREIAAGDVTVVTTTHDPMLIEHVNQVVELSDGRVVGEGIESDLVAFGQNRRREADRQLSGSRVGYSVAGDVLDVEAFPSEIKLPPPANGAERAAPRDIEEPNPARWARPRDNK